MLYEILYSLRTEIGLLNVVQYITVRTAAASLTAFVLSIVFGPFVVRWLRSMQIGQVVREDLTTHQSKAGTPTMGGLLLLGAALLPTLLWADLSNVYIWVALLSTIAFGVIGFVDDYLKVVRGSHHGLSVRGKLVAQSLCATAVGLVLLQLTQSGIYNTEIIFPFFKEFTPDIGWLYVPFAAVILVLWSNAVNLTAGLDGLASSVFTVAAGALTALAYVSGHAVIAEFLLIVRFPPAGELTIFCGSLVGAGLGFLWYNSYPADVFMGDVGSLALGAALATVALLIKQELLLFVVGAVFVIEAISVVLQVGSFKLTGQRIFKMAPLHHHFELVGWSEPKIISRFLIVAIVFALFSLTTLKLR